MNRFTIGTKLAVAFAILITLLAVTAAATRFQIGIVASDIAAISQREYPRAEQAHAIKDKTNEIARSLRNLLLMRDAGALAAQRGGIAAHEREINDIVAQLRNGATPEETAVLAPGETAAAALWRQNSLMQRSADAHDMEGALDTLLNQARPTQLALLGHVDRLIGLHRQAMEAAEVRSATQAAHASAVLLGSTVAAIVLGTLLAWRITIGITRPLQQAVQAAGEVARGNLAVAITSCGHDETGRLLRALGEMREQLRTMVGETQHGATTIATAASQIEAGNADLSSRTEQQASALQQTAASMEQMTGTIQRNAANASEANRMAQDAAGAALHGAAAVQRMADTMRQIEAGSSRIAAITKVIDGIAFQTNILALNAAVEAAHAGEQGRGFAVVAGEVRTLAQRAAEAARDIRALVDAAGAQVQAGGAHAADVGHTIDDVVARIQTVAGCMEDIQAASAEQSKGIEQINQAISEMDNVTQHNAALVEEIAAASSAMREEADMLESAVSRFRLDSAAAHRPIAALPQPRRQAPGRAPRLALAA